MSVKIFAHISIMASLALSSSAFAADVNSYRAGGTYLNSPAISHAMCESQCTGDAQCRSWNFLRSANPNMAGICELNSQIGAANPHPFAISGAANKAQSYGGANLVQGRTNVTRIGEAVTVVPQSQVRPRTISASTAPVARQIPNAPATVTRQRSFAPSAQPNTSTLPATLGSALPLVRPTSIAPSSTASSVYPVRRQTAPIQPQHIASRAVAPTASAPAAPQAPLSLMEQQIRNGANTTQLPDRAPIQAPAQSPAQAPAQAPVQATAYTPPAQTAALAPAQFASAPFPIAAPNSGLYGSLYDDVAPRPAIKQPLYSEAPTQAPDAPIVTAPRAAPVAPVFEAPTHRALSSPSMAGAAPR